jgi:putative transposase
MVHYGLAPAAIEQHRAVLDAAYRAHPERFVRKPPQPLSAPTEVWINKPQPTPENKTQ